MENIVARLKNVNELNKRTLNVISATEIMELAVNGMCPHYKIVNPLTKEEKIMFLNEDVSDWIQKECIGQFDSQFTPRLVFLTNTDCEVVSKVPEELRCIDKLYELPVCKSVIASPGIYFLCLDGIIQYIGQSTNISARVTTHVMANEKIFDTVFFIPVKKSDLNIIEATLIRTIKPPLNGNNGVLENGTITDGLELLKRQYGLKDAEKLEEAAI